MASAGSARRNRGADDARGKDGHKTESNRGWQRRRSLPRLEAKLFRRMQRERSGRHGSRRGRHSTGTARPQSTQVSTGSAWAAGYVTVGFGLLHGRPCICNRTIESARLQLRPRASAGETGVVMGRSAPPLGAWQTSGQLRTRPCECWPCAVSSRRQVCSRVAVAGELELTRKRQQRAADSTRPGGVAVRGG